MATTLILGGIRGGKTRHAQSLLSGHDNVTHLLPRANPSKDSDTWESRFAAKRDANQTGWHRVYSMDLARTLMAARGPVLIDDLSQWLSATLTTIQAWDDPARAADHLDETVAALEVTWSLFPFDIVAVSREIGFGAVPTTQAEQIYADELAQLNARLSRVADRVHLLMAGRIIDLSNAPVSEAPGIRDGR